MNYLRVPSEITINEIRSKKMALSASLYRKVVIPTSAVTTVKDLLHPGRPFDKGFEPGSMWYMRRSTRFFIRTKALQEHSRLICSKGDAITPISPRVFTDPNLSNGDILMSKDSNVGECAVVDGDSWRNHMFSGGV